MIVSAKNTRGCFRVRDDRRETLKGGLVILKKLRLYTRTPATLGGNEVCTGITSHLASSADAATVAPGFDPQFLAATTSPQTADAAASLGGLPVTLAVLAGAFILVCVFALVDGYVDRLIRLLGARLHQRRSPGGRISGSSSRRGASTRPTGVHLRVVRPSKDYRLTRFP